MGPLRYRFGTILGRFGDHFGIISGSKILKNSVTVVQIEGFCFFLCFFKKMNKAPALTKVLGFIDEKWGGACVLEGVF